jgi:hypothetical protein
MCRIVNSQVWGRPVLSLQGCMLLCSDKCCVGERLCSELGVFPSGSRGNRNVMQVVYTMGQRLVFFFPILAMWFLGPTAMLVTSVIVTSAVIVLDRWNPDNPESHVAEVLEYRATPAAETTVPAAIVPVENS